MFGEIESDREERKYVSSNVSMARLDWRGEYHLQVYEAENGWVSGAMGIRI